MDINRFVDSKYEQLKVGQKVKFKTQYGYQNCYDLEGEGVIIKMSELCQIDIKLPFTYSNRGQTDIITLHGDYDFNTKKVVFGSSQNIIQFDYPTKLNRYCHIQ